jgi:hypothetical protein
LFAARESVLYGDAAIGGVYKYHHTEGKEKPTFKRVRIDRQLWIA